MTESNDRRELESANKKSVKSNDFLRNECEKIK